jgi:hypothetical protein
MGRMVIGIVVQQDEAISGFTLMFVVDLGNSF